MEDIGERTTGDIDFEEAIKKFQSFASLEVTGEMDEKTEELMESPRCGMDDRVADFVLQGSRWNKKDLTYRISRYPTSRELTKTDVDKQTRQAFATWQEVSNLRFSEKTSGEVDID